MPYLKLLTSHGTSLGRKVGLQSVESNATSTLFLIMVRLLMRNKSLVFICNFRSLYEIGTILPNIKLLPTCMNMIRSANEDIHMLSSV